MRSLHGRRESAFVLLVTAVLVVTACAGTTVSPSTPPSSAAPSTPASTATPTPSPAPSASQAGAGIALDVVAEGLDAPVDIATAGDGSGRIFVVEQTGAIRIVKADHLQPTPFLAIADRVAAGGERGLLGLAFHPDYPADPRFFVDYTNVDGNTVVASYRVSPTDPDQADPASETILLTITQPYANHNGGALVFGTDGMLYVGMGDGGSGGDPQGNGQALDTLLGKILRIDVLGPDATATKPYGIPSDNPYAEVDASPGARPEIWLSGMRNPWRIRVDDATGILWIGDVGQAAWEEIDAITPAMGGANLGWNTMEGTHCFATDPCDRSGLTLPVAEYGHDVGCAVVGGVVVHGGGVPAIADRYVFADECSGNIWTLDPTGDGLRPSTLILDSGRAISAISLDEDGTVLMTDVSGGALVRVVSAP
jgi:glucose/arabinose dehydrogenase